MGWDGMGWNGNWMGLGRMGWVTPIPQRDILFVFLLPVLALFLLQQKMDTLRPLTAMDIVQVRHI